MWCDLLFCFVFFLNPFGHFLKCSNLIVNPFTFKDRVGAGERQPPGLPFFPEFRRDILSP